MTFQKGNQLAKGKGRPKQTLGCKWERVEELRQYGKQFSKEGIDLAVAFMRDETKPPMARLAAVNLILDRSWGKVQPDVTVNVLNVVDRMDLNELRDQLEGELGHIAEYEERLIDCQADEVASEQEAVRDETE